MGAALAGINSGLGAITGGLSARQQYKYQTKLMDKQNEQQIAFWNMNNDYNTPASQRARLESAGLNPDMMYGNGGNMVSSQTPQAASGSAPNVDFSRGPDVYGAFQLSLQSQMMQAQIEKTQWENELLKERAITESTTRDLNASLTNLRNIEGKYLPESLESQNRLRNIEGNNKLTQGQLLGAELKVYPERFKMEQQRLANDNTRLQIDISRLGLDRKKVDADLRTADALIGKLLQETKNLSSEQRNIEALRVRNDYLNYYFYKRGEVPQSSEVGFIKQSLSNALRDLFHGKPSF